MSAFNAVKLKIGPGDLECPEPEVRTPLPRVRLRTSGSKGALRIIELLVSLDSEVRMRVCRKCLRTSESGH